MFLIRDFDIGPVWKILENLDSTSDYALRESNHVMFSFSKRINNVNRTMVYDALINKNPVLIGKTDYATFKVIYEHPTKTSEDIYIILNIDEDENILIITIYTHSNERRKRHHEM